MQPSTIVLFLILALTIPCTTRAGQHGSFPSNWESIRANSAGPTPRDAMAAYAFGNVIYTFGGFNENLDATNPTPNVFYNDVWAYDTFFNSWTKIVTHPDPLYGSPIARAYSIAGALGSPYSPMQEQDEFIVGFGITYTATFGDLVAYNDVWAFNTITHTWRQISALNSATAPSPRAETNAAVFNGKLVISGGATQYFGTLTDTWILDVASSTWTNLNLAVSPSGRYGSATALDYDNHRMIIYGGERTVYTATGIDYPFAGPDAQWAFSFDTLTWTQIVPLYQLADRNNGNGAVYVDGKFFLFGGDLGGGQSCANAIFTQNQCNQTWVWDSNINVYNELCPSVAPPVLKRAVTVLVGYSTVYMFGGFVFNSATCGPYSFPTNLWKYNVEGCFGGVPCAANY